MLSKGGCRYVNFKMRGRGNEGGKAGRRGQWEVRGARGGKGGQALATGMLLWIAKYTIIAPFHKGFKKLPHSPHLP